MKKKNFAYYDYGTGGVWRIVYARSKEQVIEKFPGFTGVRDETEEWPLEQNMEGIVVSDIDEEPDEFLKDMQKSVK